MRQDELVKPEANVHFCRGIGGRGRLLGGMEVMLAVDEEALRKNGKPELAVFKELSLTE